MKPLTEATVLHRMLVLHVRGIGARKRLDAELADIERCRAEIRACCPHTRTHVETGQYMPCVEVCNLCGAEIAK